MRKLKNHNYASIGLSRPLTSLKQHMEHYTHPLTLRPIKLKSYSSLVSCDLVFVCLFWRGWETPTWAIFHFFSTSKSTACNSNEEEVLNSKAQRVQMLLDCQHGVCSSHHVKAKHKLLLSSLCFFIVWSRVLWTIPHHQTCNTFRTQNQTGEHCTGS